MTAALTVVTGASAAYARCLWQLLRDAERHGLHTAHRWLVYDLGLDPVWRTRLAQRFAWCGWRTLTWSALPPHVHPARRTYAWKPLALHAAGAESGGQLLWLDSATLFRGPLTAITAAIRRYGVYTLAGQSPLLKRCDPEVWTAAGSPAEILDQPERAAGVIGLDLAQPVARRLLDAWRDQALRPALWRPLSDRHRPEQSLLSILIYRAVRADELTLNPGEIDIGCIAPVHSLTTRNKVPLAFPLWADPFARAYFTLWKTADRLVLRARRFRATRLHGWHRFWSEHYRVQLARPEAGTAAVALPSPPGGYYADPFPWLHRGELWLFAEAFHYATNAGRLVALPLGPDLAPAGPARALNLPPGHFSFPFVFAHGGELCLLPESSGRRTVDLYTCVDFPAAWRLRRRLLVDLDAADSVFLHHADRWWLFTSVRPEPAHSRRALAIFFTDDPFTGELTPHPVNREQRYLTAPCGTGRCAGPFVRDAAGALYRPIHWSRRFYGEGVRLMRLVDLTPTAFEEVADPGPSPLAALTAAVAPHHLAAHPALIALDHRDRIPGWPWRRRPALILPNDR